MGVGVAKGGVVRASFGNLNTVLSINFWFPLARFPPGTSSLSGKGREEGVMTSNLA